MKWNFESNDALIGRKAVDKNLYYARWDVPYKTGKVQAIGYKNNKKITEHTLKTAGNASEIKVTASKTSLKANNEDVAILEVTIVDKNGIPVPDATQEIKVDITGPAKLIGLDNGNQSDVSAFKSNKRKGYEGRLLITLQATNNAGPVKVEVSSPGLKTATAFLQAIK